MLRLLSEDGLLHFDLFASNAALLLEGSQALQRIYGSSYPFIILDELQDTNEDEWRFIRALTRHSQVMALADPEQRIYAFRGASAARINEFKQVYGPDLIFSHLARSITEATTSISTSSATTC